MKEGQERRKKKGWEEKREDVNRDIRDEEEKKKTELNCSRAVKEREREEVKGKQRRVWFYSSCPIIIIFIYIVSTFQSTVTKCFTRHNKKRGGTVSSSDVLHRVRQLNSFIRNRTKSKWIQTTMCGLCIKMQLHFLLMHKHSENVATSSVFYFHRRGVWSLRQRGRAAEVKIFWGLSV